MIGFCFESVIYPIANLAFKLSSLFLPLSFTSTIKSQFLPLAFVLFTLLQLIKAVLFLCFYAFILLCSAVKK